MGKGFWKKSYENFHSVSNRAPFSNMLVNEARLLTEQKWSDENFVNYFLNTVQNAVLH